MVKLTKHMNICLVSFKVFLCGIFITTKTIVDFSILFCPLAKVLKMISLLCSIRDMIKDILRYMSSQRFTCFVSCFRLACWHKYNAKAKSDEASLFTSLLHLNELYPLRRHWQQDLVNHETSKRHE